MNLLDEIQLQMISDGWEFDGELEGTLYFRTPGKRIGYFLTPREGKLILGKYRFHKHHLTDPAGLELPDIEWEESFMNLNLGKNTHHLELVDILLSPVDCGERQAQVLFPA